MNIFSHFSVRKGMFTLQNIFCALQCDKWGKVDAADEKKREEAGSTARENSLFYHVVPEYVKMMMMCVIKICFLHQKWENFAAYLISSLNGFGVNMTTHLKTLNYSICLYNSYYLETFEQYHRNLGFQTFSDNNLFWIIPTEMKTIPHSSFRIC